MFTTIRDESDRLLKSATVLLISFDSVPLLSFLLHSTCAGAACYIVIRVSQISSILETNRTVDGTRVNVTREIHRNYIGIRVLIRVSRVNDVHEDFHSRRIKLNINFKGERKKKKKKTSAEFYNMFDTKFYRVYNYLKLFRHNFYDALKIIRNL